MCPAGTWTIRGNSIREFFDCPANCLRNFGRLVAVPSNQFWQYRDMPVDLLVRFALSAYPRDRFNRYEAQRSIEVFVPTQHPASKSGGQASGSDGVCGYGWLPWVAHNRSAA